MGWVIIYTNKWEGETVSLCWRRGGDFQKLPTFWPLWSVLVPVGVSFSCWNYSGCIMGLWFLWKSESSATLNLIDSNQFLLYPQWLCHSFKDFPLPFILSPTMSLLGTWSLLTLTPQKIKKIDKAKKSNWKKLLWSRAVTEQKNLALTGKHIDCESLMNLWKKSFLSLTRIIFKIHILWYWWYFIFMMECFRENLIFIESIHLIL